MSQVAQASEDNGGEALPVPILPRTEQLTAVQINNILSVLNMLGALIRQSDENDYDNKAMDGGIKAAVAASIHTALTQLDNIVKDGARWNLDSHMLLERLVAANLKANVSMSEQHMLTQAYLRLPHVHLRPTITRLDDGTYTAHIGGIQDELIGFGDTPADALASFDDVILGEIDKSAHYEQIQKLDKRGNKSTTRGKGKGRKREGDSEKSEPDDQGS